MKIVFLVFFLLFLLAGFLIFKLFMKIVKKSVKKRQADFWIGKLVDKKMFEDSDDESSITDYHYYLFIKTDEGKDVKYSVNAKDYEQFNVGDRLEKKVGEVLPSKI